MDKKFLPFAGGVHPPQSKHYTGSKKIEICNVPNVVYIPLKQNKGVSCEALVKKGDTVKLGQKIGEPKGYVGVPVHSSVSGTVKSVTKIESSMGGKELTIVIENDGLDTFDESITQHDPGSLSPEQLKNLILEAGVVGMGGATFPTSVKLSPPIDKKIELVILNGAECEPYLTGDYRLMLEKTQDIITGLKIIMKVLNVPNAFIGIEDNKSDAINVMEEALKSEDNIKVVKLKTKYPQGDEKQLIYTITGRQVPPGGLPMDVGVVVHNVGTAVVISDAVIKGLPLYQRIVTISGGAIKEPKNLLVRVGTTFKNVADFCGGFVEEPAKVISGGPMMGIAQHTLDVPVVKGTTGILFFTEKESKMPETSECIKCARCVDVCPVNLMPLYISGYYLKGNLEQAEKFHAVYCIECGCCSYICPAARPLVESIRLAKNEILSNRKVIS